MLSISELDPSRYVAPQTKLLPNAACGDPQAATTYEAVGRCLSCFEKMDAMMSHFFAYLVTNDPVSMPARRAYGTPHGYDVRRQMILDASEARIISENDLFFSQLKSLMNTARQLGKLRNNVAHGVVATFYNFTTGLFEEEKGWCVISSYTHTSLHVLRAPGLWGAGYVYSSLELNILGSKFSEFSTLIQKLVYDLTDQKIPS